VADGELYRLVTSGFLHAGLFHIAFNMVALYFLGSLLEPGIGTPRFLAVYFVVPRSMRRALRREVQSS
jgi:membrane associated rhomboid family serine protease